MDGWTEHKCTCWAVLRSLKFHIFPLKIWAKKVSFFIPVIFLSVNGTQFGIHGCLKLWILPNFDLNTVCIKNWPYFPINLTNQLAFFIYASFFRFKPVSASFCQFLPAEITTLIWGMRVLTTRVHIVHWDGVEWNWPWPEPGWRVSEEAACADMLRVTGGPGGGAGWCCWVGPGGNGTRGWGRRGLLCVIMYHIMIVTLPIIFSSKEHVHLSSNKPILPM